jgi:predicted SAM-dependent methyltransferase
MSPRTARLLIFDLMRLRARLLRGRTRKAPASDKLHLGCGTRKVAGWINVDVWGSEFDVDIASGRLPWHDGVFSAVVSQHVIEHLDLQTQLLPLARELRRVVRPGGEVWLSCPDLEKVCRSYVEDRAARLAADRRQRMPSQALPPGMPTQHFVNWLFQQGGEHQNLYDLELLAWVMQEAGFPSCARVTEADVLARFPEFPVRGDDVQSLYVKAQ